MAEIVDKPEPCEKGCHRYVIKPRTGCGSEGVRITSFVRARPGEIVTRYHEGLHLSASFIVGKEGFLPLTINRQLIKFEGDGMSYQGSQVPYNTPRADGDLGGGKEGCSCSGPARVRGDRLRAGRTTKGGGRERQADNIHHRHRQGDARGDRGADIAGEVWGDGGEGACGGRARFPERRSHLNQSP